MVSFQFSNPEFFLFFLALPIIIFTHFALFKFTKRRAMVFANLETLKRVTGKNIMTRNITVLIIRLLAVSAVILALTGPVMWFEGPIHRTEYVLAIDNSASMTAADLLPTRFDAAKEVSNQFVDGMNASGRIGVLGFAGTAQVMTTVTSDMGVVRASIDELEIREASGTDIGNAIITGTNLLLGTSRPRAMILFTDGSTTTTTFTDDPLSQGIDYANQHNVKVHTIGVGIPDSAPVGYLPRLYNITAAYDPAELVRIADETGGTFNELQEDSQIDDIVESLREDTVSGLRQREMSVGFLMIALLFMLLEWGLVNTRFRIVP